MVAPAPGKVVRVVEGLEDHRPYLPDPPAKGNHVYIDHGNGELSLLYHLKKGSATVEVGDTVHRAQTIGLCGNTGISMFPHLHYQLFSGTIEDTRKIKTRFSAYYSWKGTNDIEYRRKDLILNVIGIPDRTDNVANLSYFLHKFIHEQ